jgi:plastocyanin
MKPMTAFISWKSRFCIPVLAAASFCSAQQAITGHVAIDRQPETVKGSAKTDNSMVVVWLTPTASQQNAASPVGNARLTQKDKRFIPELLVVPVGSSVEFPNRDPFFHNVFSLFEGKRFDLGLYQAGETRQVRFDREGVSYIFCNIHPEMHAVVIALSTPFYAVSGPRGEIRIPDVPPGNYQMHVWYARAAPEALQRLSEAVSVSSHPVELPLLRLQEVRLSAEHKNKFGKDYDRTPTTPLY